MLKWILILAGGGLGSVLRYSIAGWCQGSRSGFPIGTLVVNLSGCFLIGFLNALFSGQIPIRPEYRVGLSVGILGGFTTFSAFGWETFTLTNNAAYWRAGLNVSLSVILGFGCVWLGYRLGQQLVGTG